MMNLGASVRVYLVVWAFLAGLMLVSVFLSEASVLALSQGALACVVLALSTAKALLVALYYMHLKFDRHLLAFVAGFPLVLIGLATLLVLSSRLVRL